MKKIVPLILCSVVLSALCAGCPVSTKTSTNQGNYPVTVHSGYYGGAAPAQFQGLAKMLAAKGFSNDEIHRFVNSPDLRFSPAPMETKLRELYGIFYKSELTKEIQEKLYCLGYDLTIDGRKGSGTKNAIIRFQNDNGLSATGAVSDSTLASINQVMKKKSGSLRSLASYTPPPAQKPSRTSTHKQFTNPSALSQIGQHYAQDKAIFDRMSKKYNVPGSVVASIMWIETGYGSYFGKSAAGCMLGSMAAASDFKLIAPAVADLAADSESRAWLAETAQKRGGWALDELTALLHYCYKNNLDPNKLPGSIYGAIGYGQFMPSNAEKFGADGNGDGIVDLFNKEDAIFSVGRYLEEHGWHGHGLSEDERRAVIMKYNKSGVYVNTVLYVADWLGKNIN